MKKTRLWNLLISLASPPPPPPPPPKKKKKKKRKKEKKEKNLHLSVCLSECLSLSLSHTHTHTQSLSAWSDEMFCFPTLPPVISMIKGFPGHGMYTQLWCVFYPRDACSLSYLREIRLHLALSGEHVGTFTHSFFVAVAM